MVWVRQPDVRETTWMIEWSLAPNPSQLKRIGKCIRDGLAGEAEFAGLGAYQRRADEVQRHATDRLRQSLLGQCLQSEQSSPGDFRLGWPTGDWLRVLPGRAKTTLTLTEKLKRMPACSLANVRDVAGVRVVLAGNLTQQAYLCAAAVALLHEQGERDPVLIDHRSTPVSGYRALHAEIRIGRMPVEIQVRTEMQESWANLFERVADEWGRGIRYGELPTANVEFASICVDLLSKISLVIQKYEDNLDQYELAVAVLPHLGASNAPEEAIGQLAESTRLLSEVLPDLRQELLDMLDRLSGLVDRATTRTPGV